MRHWACQSQLKNTSGKNDELTGSIQPRRCLGKLEWILLLSLWFTSCQTLPRWESQNPWDLFPPDVSFYLYLTVPEHREFLESLLSRVGEHSNVQGNVPRGVSYFLDHTSAVYLAILGSESEASSLPYTSYRWILIGVGEYSSFLLRLSLTPEEGWEKKKIQAGEYSLSYYHHAGSGVQIALPDTRLLLVSNREIEFPLRQFILPSTDPSRCVRPPLGSTSLGLYIPKSGIPFLATLLEPIVPHGTGGIEGFLVNFERAGSRHYSAGGSILFGKEEQARSMTVFLRLALASWFLQQRGNGIPATVQIQAKGTSIGFSGIPLPLETIAQFVDSMIHRIIRILPW